MLTNTTAAQDNIIDSETSTPEEFRAVLIDLDNQITAWKLDYNNLQKELDEAKQELDTANRTIESLEG